MVADMRLRRTLDAGGSSSPGGGAAGRLLEQFRSLKMRRPGALPMDRERKEAMKQRAFAGSQSPRYGSKRYHREKRCLPGFVKSLAAQGWTKAIRNGDAASKAAQHVRKRRHPSLPLRGRSSLPGEMRKGICDGTAPPRTLFTLSRRGPIAGEGLRRGFGVGALQQITGRPRIAYRHGDSPTWFPSSFPSS